MKRFFNIILAGLLLLPWVACTEVEKTFFDPSASSAPVLQGYELGERNLVVDYTPATFNVVAPVYHTLALVSLDGNSLNKTLKTSIKDGKISLSLNELNKALLEKGYPYDTPIAVEMVVRASLQSASADNGLNGYMDSEGKISLDYTMTEPSSSDTDPYAAYKEVSTWSVIGSIASTGNNWGQDEVMYTDGTWHVARSIVLTTSDQFKFRKDAGWDTNFGAEGDVEPFVVELDTEYPAAAGGKNLAVPADGTYDLWLNPEEGLFRIALPMASGSDPYADFTETSAWSVIGSIASTGNSWGQDEAMITDGTLHVCRGLVLTTSDQFKFRKDGGWDTNFGAEGDVEPFVVELDTEYPAAAGGKNLAVPADGKYDLILNPDDATYKVILAQEGTVVDPYAAYTDESDWSVIGSIASTGNSWGQDETMYTDGEWHVCKALTLLASDQFKFRKDGSWTTNFGAEGDVEPFVVTLDEEYTATANGKNLSVPEDGVYDLLLNPDEEIFKVIKSIATDVTPVTPPTPPTEIKWSLIGDFNDWAGDIFLSESNGIWKGTLTAPEGGTTFKIRQNEAWSVSYGGPEKNYIFYGGDDPDSYKAVIGEAFAAGEANIYVEAGDWDVTLDLTDESAPTILVDVAAPPADTWSLIGDFNDWAGDIFLTDNDGIWKGTLSVSESTTFKIRKNSEWAVSYGGPEKNYPFYGEDNDVYKPVIGEAFAAGDANIFVEAGDWDVTLDLTDESAPTILVEGALPPVDTWSIIGVVDGTNWDTDFDLTYSYDTGLYSYASINFEAGKGFKIRMNHDWGTNRGAEGDVEPYTMNSGEALPVVNNGKNLAVAVNGEYSLVYDPSAETITVTLIAEGPDTPEPDETTWGIIGEFNSWGDDVFMTESDGIWTGILTVSDVTTFKIRKNSAWDVSYGGPEANYAFYGSDNDVYKPVLGEAFAAGSLNVYVEAGTWAITLNLTDEAAPTIKVESTTPQVDDWSIIGEVAGTSWNTDFDLAYDSETGLYTYDSIAFEAGKGFKIRKNHDWGTNRGAEGDVEPYTMTSGEALPVVNNGKNLTVAESGNYKLVYSPAAETITVTKL